MAPPTLSKRMARAAIAALLAAVEIYNKPTVNYREQTFAMLIINAWEVLLKARIVQQNDNNLSSIKDKDRADFTMSLSNVLSKVDIPADVRRNIEALNSVRNEAVHMGIVPQDLQSIIFSIGTSGVQNFINFVSEWFSEPVPISYLLPVGFIGHAQVANISQNKKQRALLQRLIDIVESASSDRSEYTVAMHMDIQVNPVEKGGFNIHPTLDPSAISVQYKIEDIMKKYPQSYDEIRKMCRERYRDFSDNRRFKKLMKEVIKEDMRYSFARRYNPKNPQSQVMYHYKGSAVLDVLDQYYTRR